MTKHIFLSHALKWERLWFWSLKTIEYDGSWFFCKIIVTHFLTLLPQSLLLWTLLLLLLWFLFSYHPLIPHRVEKLPSQLFFNISKPNLINILFRRRLYLLYKLFYEKWGKEKNSKHFFCVWVVFVTRHNVLLVYKKLKTILFNHFLFFNYFLTIYGVCKKRQYCNRMIEKKNSLLLLNVHVLCLRTQNKEKQIPSVCLYVLDFWLWTQNFRKS